MVNPGAALGDDVDEIIFQLDQDWLLAAFEGGFDFGLICAGLRAPFKTLVEKWNRIARQNGRNARHLKVSTAKEEGMGGAFLIRILWHTVLSFFVSFVRTAVLYHR